MSDRSEGTPEIQLVDSPMRFVEFPEPGKNVFDEHNMFALKVILHDVVGSPVPLRKTLVKYKCAASLIELPGSLRRIETTSVGGETVGTFKGHMTVIHTEKGLNILIL
ncbi:unnamed protein product [Hermetia illucens]|uniref:Uncharacterized protein n=1 Tax=Hermetia illucens TaxID=343691 RepID=A0A7R8YQX3_HERIL|nr:unnamed protein product [Hermetia illucens]